MLTAFSIGIGLGDDFKVFDDCDVRLDRNMGTPLLLLLDFQMEKSIVLIANKVFGRDLCNLDPKGKA